MTSTTPVDPTEAVEDFIVDNLSSGKTIASVEVGGPVWHALELAHAVSKLIDFGGGILKLPSGQKFKLLRPCEECEVAAPMVTPGAILSKFCARCANELAGQYKDLCE